MRDDTRGVHDRVEASTKLERSRQIRALLLSSASAFSDRQFDHGYALRKQVPIDEARRELLRRFDRHPLRDWSPTLMTAVTAVIDAHCLGGGVSFQPFQDVPRLRVVE